MSYSKRNARKRKKRFFKSQGIRLGFRYKKIALQERFPFSALVKYERSQGMSIKEMMRSRADSKSIEFDGNCSDFYSPFSFFDDEKKPQLKDSFCVFLDVLGFTQRLEDSYLEGNKDDLFNDFVSISRAEITKIKNKSALDLGLVSRVFSDNILLAQPIFSEDCETEFWAILHSALEYQLEMALSGFFVRGGFVRGELFVDEEIIYGKALLDSVRYEGKLALTSRVMLSESVLDKVNEHLDFYDKKSSSPQYEQVFLNKGCNGSLADNGFLNYLTVLTISGHLDAERLIRHRDQVIYSAMKYRDSKSLAYKYYWLYKYHNYFCSTVEGYKEFKKECYIGEELFAGINLQELISNSGNESVSEGLFQFERLKL